MLVLSVPAPPTLVSVPLLSSQEASPVPSMPSVHENDVATTWPTLYVPPDAGEVIDAAGGSATV